MVDGKTEEMTEFEFKKMEKEKQVIQLRERLAKLKEKVRAPYRSSGLAFYVRFLKLRNR